MARYVVFWGYEIGDGLHYEAEAAENILEALRRAGETGGFVIPACQVEEVIEKLKEAARA